LRACPASWWMGTCHGCLARSCPLCAAARQTPSAGPPSLCLCVCVGGGAGVRVCGGGAGHAVQQTAGKREREHTPPTAPPALPSLTVTRTTTTGGVRREPAARAICSTSVALSLPMSLNLGALKTAPSCSTWVPPWSHARHTLTAPWVGGGWDRQVVGQTDRQTE
jgi:hypothetical protein